MNIEREIEEILDKDLFLAYHEAKGHCLTEHCIDTKTLKQRLWDMPKPKFSDDIVAATRFFDENSALIAIHDTLINHISDIIKWRKMLDYPYLEITHEFTTPIGEGLCKNTDKSLIPMHCIRVILINNDKNGRAFYIKTAYPTYSMDDIDIIYEKMDDFENKRKRGKR